MTAHRLSRRTFATGAAILPLAAISPAIVRAQTPAASSTMSPLKVVATFSILADWVTNVMGDLATVSTIVPAGSDTHTFDPTPDQVQAIVDADLLFEIGLGFESWLPNLIDSSGTSATRVVVSDGIEVLHFGDDADDHDDHDDEDHEEEGDDHDHDHGTDDPHIWGDVANAIHAVGLIAAALGEADSINAATWQANADAFVSELQTLDEAVRTETATLPEDRRKLVTTHDTFAYYAHAYDFEIVGTALNSVTTESGDPSAQQIVDLVMDIRDENVPAIFAENVSNNAIIETIASEAGVELAPPLYSDALGDAESPASTYITMMQYNTTTIVTALT